MLKEDAEMQKLILINFKNIIHYHQHSTAKEIQEANISK